MRVVGGDEDAGAGSWQGGRGTVNREGACLSNGIDMEGSYQLDLGLTVR